MRPMLREGIKADRTLNPGLCWVSYECSEATVDHDVLLSMLEPYVRSGKLSIFLRTAPVAVEKRGNRIQSVTVYGFESHRFLRLRGTVFIDATELGEFLPLAGAEFVTGAESRAETGEPDAPLQADPARHRVLPTPSFSNRDRQATIHRSRQAMTATRRIFPSSPPMPMARPFLTACTRNCRTLPDPSGRTVD